MALVKCKECGKKISDTVEKCPQCGYAKKKIKLFWPIILVLIAIGYLTPSKVVNKVDTKSKTKVETKTTTSSSINEVGRKAASARWNDSGYTKAYFPQKESFWIILKDPPLNSDLYADLACRTVKKDYNIKGFTITIWNFNNKKFGKARCY